MEGLFAAHIYFLREDTMSSTNKTERLKLNQWELSDPFLMEDMNGDNAKIDAAVVRIEGELDKRATVKLMEKTLTAKTENVDLDFSGIDLTDFIEVQVYFPHANSVRFTVNDYKGNIHADTTGGWKVDNYGRYLAIGYASLRNTLGLGGTEGDMYICSGEHYYYYPASVIGPLRKFTLENSSGFSAGGRFVAIGVRA